MSIGRSNMDHHVNLIFISSSGNCQRLWGQFTSWVVPSQRNSPGLTPQHLWTKGSETQLSSEYAIYYGCTIEASWTCIEAWYSSCTQNSNKYSTDDCRHQTTISQTLLLEVLFEKETTYSHFCHQYRAIRTQTCWVLNGLMATSSVCQFFFIFH